MPAGMQACTTVWAKNRRCHRQNWRSRQPLRTKPQYQDTSPARIPPLHFYISRDLLLTLRTTATQPLPHGASIVVSSVNPVNSLTSYIVRDACPHDCFLNWSGSSVLLPNSASVTRPVKRATCSEPRVDPLSLPVGATTGPEWGTSRWEHNPGDSFDSTPLRIQNCVHVRRERRFQVRVPRNRWRAQACSSLRAASGSLSQGMDTGHPG